MHDVEADIVFGQQARLVVQVDVVAVIFDRQALGLDDGRFEEPAARFNSL